MSIFQKIIILAKHLKRLCPIAHKKWKYSKRKGTSFQDKVRIVFVCHRAEIWESLKSVFYACNNDKQFDVTIVAIPNKKQLPQKGLNHEIYETEGAEDFFKNFPCKVINGYNYQTHTWIDLKSLRPDYLFFQTPYNICRPRQYHSKKVSNYCRLCYVHYGMLIFKGEVQESVYPVDFFRDVYLAFSENEEQTKILSEKTHVILTGCPRFDNLQNIKNKESDVWNMPRNKFVKRIIWTPRWCTNEQTCHFFDYKDKLLDYARQNKDIDFVFRPHPQAFLEWNATGELTIEQANKYKQQYDACPNAKIDYQKEYLTTFYSSDMLITDISSIIVDYYLTGKPIIYCHKTNHFNNFGTQLSKGFYWVHNWEELRTTIEQLKQGKDPLFETRQKIIKENFYFNPQGAGYTIKEWIKKDFYG